jgi:hypothetical protein
MVSRVAVSDYWPVRSPKISPPRRQLPAPSLSESYDGVNVKPSSIQPATPPIIIFTSKPSRARRNPALLASVAMRARAVDHKQLVLRILSHPRGRHLAVRDVDRALHEALCECVRTLTDRNRRPQKPKALRRNRAKHE